jgi:hypothetical protein
MAHAATVPQTILPTLRLSGSGATPMGYEGGRRSALISSPCRAPQEGSLIAAAGQMIFFIFHGTDHVFVRSGPNIGTGQPPEGIAVNLGAVWWASRKRMPIKCVHAGIFSRNDRDHDEVCSDRRVHRGVPSRILFCVCAGGKRAPRSARCPAGTGVPARAERSAHTPEIGAGSPADDRKLLYARCWFRLLGRGIECRSGSPSRARRCGPNTGSNP